MDRSTERGRISHLVSSLARICNPLPATQRGPSIVKGPSKFQQDAGHIEAVMDIGSAEDCIDPHATPLSHIDDPHDLPLVSLGQGTSRVDYPARPVPAQPVEEPVAKRAAKDLCDLYGVAYDLAGIPKGTVAIDLPVRASIHREPAQVQTNDDPGHPEHYTIQAIHLRKDVQYGLLCNFVDRAAKAGYSLGMIEIILPIVAESIRSIPLGDIGDTVVDAMAREITARMGGGK
jgi:hypothetical protein